MSVFVEIIFPCFLSEGKAGASPFRQRFPIPAQWSGDPQITAPSCQQRNADAIKLAAICSQTRARLAYTKFC